MGNRIFLLVTLVSVLVPNCHSYSSGPPGLGFPEVCNDLKPNTPPSGHGKYDFSEGNDDIYIEVIEEPEKNVSAGVYPGKLIIKFQLANGDKMKGMSWST